MKKKLLTLCAFVYSFSILFAQAPEAINFQATVRDANGNAITNQLISVQFQLYQTTAVGPLVYAETHNPTTTDIGLFTVAFGDGTPTTGTFSSIDWSAGPYFMEVALDTAGGSSYVSIGTQQLLSVPFALYATTAENVINDQVDDADADCTNELQSLYISGDTLFISKGNFVVISGLSLTCIYGCTDPASSNYDPAATCDDGSCCIDGCTDPASSNYDPSATCDDGSCCTDGCTDPASSNYDPSATCDDGSCIPCVYGCTDPASSNYDPAATCDDGSCCIDGCTDPASSNYDPAATCDDGSCCIDGCTDAASSNYDPSATCDDGSCIPCIYGCTDAASSNYDPSATCDDSSCIPCVYGCADPAALNYNPIATCDDGSCIGIGATYSGGIVFYLDGAGGGLVAGPMQSDPYDGAYWGCSGTSVAGADGTAIGTGNQNTVDIEAGCTTPGIAADICANLTLAGYSDWFLPSKDELTLIHWSIGPGDALGLGNVGGYYQGPYWSSTEFDITRAWAVEFGGGSQYGFFKAASDCGVIPVRALDPCILGCTNPASSNYDPAATCDDGSCCIDGCTDPTSSNYDPAATCDDGSCCIDGCTDPASSNYDPAATCDDGSCCIDGCTDAASFNYDPSATCDDGSCIPCVYDCTDPVAPNYNSAATCDDGSCIGIGDTYEGGIVFYLDGAGGGLVAAPVDQSSTGVEWGCFGFVMLGADGTAIGTGNQNTIDIEAGCTTPGIAADICANLTFGGYSDWFLPSKDELNLMYLNIGQGNALGLGNVGSFIGGDYWSSTEYDLVFAWTQQFGNGSQSTKVKTLARAVRAVRAF